MTPTAHDLIKPLTIEEKSRVMKATQRLFINDDFQLVFRSLNADCLGVLNPSFEGAKDPIAAAYLDGQKEPVRWLFSAFLNELPTEEKPSEQITA